MAISGRQGLFNLITQTRTGILVESLNDKKRFTISAQQQVHALDEIAMYYHDGEKPLRELYENMEDALSGEKSVSHKAKNDEIIETFGQYVPNYDQDRVYISDMKKFFNWYNMLSGHEFFIMEPKDSDNLGEEIKEAGNES